MAGTGPPCHRERELSCDCWAGLEWAAEWTRGVHVHPGSSRPLSKATAGVCVTDIQGVPRLPSRPCLLVLGHQPRPLPVTSSQLTAWARLRFLIWSCSEVLGGHGSLEMSCVHALPLSHTPALAWNSPSSGLGLGIAGEHHPVQWALGF